MRRLLGGLVRAPLLCRLAVDGRAALAVDEHVEAHAASGLDEEPRSDGAREAALDDLVDALLLLLEGLVLHMVAQAYVVVEDAEAQVTLIHRPARRRRSELAPEHADLPGHLLLHLLC